MHTDTSTPVDHDAAVADALRKYAAAGKLAHAPFRDAVLAKAKTRLDAALAARDAAATD